MMCIFFIYIYIIFVDVMCAVMYVCTVFWHICVFFFFNACAHIYICVFILLWLFSIWWFVTALNNLHNFAFFVYNRIWPNGQRVREYASIYWLTQSAHADWQATKIPSVGSWDWDCADHVCNQQVVGWSKPSRSIWTDLYNRLKY